MLDKVNKTLLKVFGSRNERLVKAYSVIADQAGEFEQRISQLDDDALKAKTADFKATLSSGTLTFNSSAVMSSMRERSPRWRLAKAKL
jgi:preprotein translocase subunit SecA